MNCRTGFLDVWKRCFQHVKVREYKNVCGKCVTCAELSSLRSAFRDSKRRNETTRLHAFHRSTYMGERAVYYEQKRLAMEMPAQYCSIITDGMAQSHTILPWGKNLYMHSQTIEQHLQGVLQHGQSTNIYRTFPNIFGGANLAIHVVLMDLLERYERDGCLPPTVFIRVDGGSENANKFLLAICELIVSRRLCQTIIISRLPVGHTHEDIDGVFSRIWTKMRDASVATPQKYMHYVKSIFKPRHGEAEGCKSSKFVDLFCLPDYKAFLERYVDPKFGKVFREQWTQHCFRFRSVPPSTDFPLGVEMHYRAYAQDEVFEIVDSNRWECGKAARKCYVSWLPEGKGLYLLRSLPTGAPKGASFVAGSCEKIKLAVNAIMRHFEKYEEHVARYRGWLERMPKSDNVNDFIRDRGLNRRPPTGEMFQAPLMSAITAMIKLIFYLQYAQQILCVGVEEMVNVQHPYRMLVSTG